MDRYKMREWMGKNDPVIFEIGAADGIDTLETLTCIGDPGMKIYCFEPDPRNVVSFKERIKGDSRVDLFELAIGDMVGKATFNQSIGTSIYSSSLKKPTKHLYETWPQIKFENELEVDVTTIDEFTKNHGIDIIDFVWADVQGAEDLMIKGSPDSFRNKIRFLYTEYSNVPYYEKEPTLQQIIEMLGSDWELEEDYVTDAFFVNKRLQEKLK